VRYVTKNEGNMRFLVLSHNYEKYKSGFYHQDLVDALGKYAECIIYGQGYRSYDRYDTIEDVLAKKRISINDLDLIVVTTSWEIQDPSIPESDPHPAICLSKINNVPKVFFLNKEYKKINKKLEYARKNQFDLVLTVHPLYSIWSKNIGIPFMQLPFGISLERFKDYGMPKKWDFGFAGSLHRSHTDARYLAKKQLFEERFIDKKASINKFYQPCSECFQEWLDSYNVCWMEWGAKDWLGKSMLPTGLSYAKFLNSTRAFLNTPSALGIINTRYFELMASRSLIICPKSDVYDGVLMDGYNCVMVKPDFSDLRGRLQEVLDDHGLWQEITDNAAGCAKSHDYFSRVDAVITRLKIL